MKILAIIRHLDDTKQLIRLFNVEGAEDAIATIKEKVPTAKVILALVQPLEG